ncbi:hypothetical protein Droror1_Dr00011527 [Drosera rotundifolia]
MSLSQSCCLYLPLCLKDGLPLMRTLEELKDYGSTSLLQMAAELLNDRLPEAREAARSIAKTLYESFSKEHDKGEIQESWRSYCKANLPALHAQSIVKVTVA